MSPIAILLIGIAMSTDAFAAAIGKGAAMGKPRLRDALYVGVIFGVIETLTPIAGWLLGQIASQYVTTFDHWIAFGLLSGLGIHMIVTGFKCDDNTNKNNTNTHHPKGRWLILAATALATSIDAAAVGISLAFLDVQIGVVAAVVGLCTLTMVTVGVMLGRVLGTLVGKRAEIVGGMILIIVGSTILYEHLSSTG
ncbi:MAG TPA: manganese efflux pump MntP [Xylella taiwanensis]